MQTIFRVECCVCLNLDVCRLRRTYSHFYACMHPRARVYAHLHTISHAYHCMFLNLDVCCRQMIKSGWLLCSYVQVSLEPFLDRESVNTSCHDALSLFVSPRGPSSRFSLFRISLFTQDKEALSCAAQMVRLLFDSRFRAKVYQQCTVTGLKLSSTRTWIFFSVLLTWLDC